MIPSYANIYMYMHQRETVHKHIQLGTLNSLVGFNIHQFDISILKRHFQTAGENLVGHTQ